MPKRSKVVKRKGTPTTATPNEIAMRCVWTQEEDDELKSLVKEMGVKQWVAIGENMRQRISESDKTGKQCRERWHNHLNPNINRAPWTTDEESIFFKLHCDVGNKWSEISRHLPGRTDNSIKNFFYCKMRKMVRKITKGIISEDQKCSLIQLRHSMYLLWHLKQYYVGLAPQKAQALGKWKGDKYILDIVNESGIDTSRLHNYLSNLLATVPSSFTQVMSQEFPGLKIDSILHYQPSSRKISTLEDSEPSYTRDSGEISNPILKGTIFMFTKIDLPQAVSAFTPFDQIFAYSGEEEARDLTLPFPSNMYQPCFRPFHFDNVTQSPEFQFLIMDNTTFKLTIKDSLSLSPNL